MWVEALQPWPLLLGTPRAQLVNP
uniref:Uncharacterized protein n=1 Tax=Arundo donax TaxID=35708 RepID=A0A0A9ABX2_ARUDO